MRSTLKQRLILLSSVLLLAGTCFAADSAQSKQTSVNSEERGNSSSVMAQPASSPSLPVGTSLQQPLSGEQIKWRVVSAGGVRGTSPSYALTGTVGQTAVGLGSSTNFKINQGFWQNFVTACTACGDANGDAVVDISDAVFLIAYIFSGGAAPGDCNYANGMGDANGDGSVDISDAVYLIAYIFSGGPAPHCS